MAQAKARKYAPSLFLGYNQLMSEHTTSCIFCQIVAGTAEASFVYRDADCAAFMDIRPVNPGHVLVVSLAHAARLAELDPATGQRIFSIAQRVAAALYSSGLQCDGVNLFLADGHAAGQEVHHVHLHVFPRFADDGHRLRFSPSYFLPHSRVEIENAAEKIRASLKGWNGS